MAKTKNSNEENAKEKVEYVERIERKKEAKTLKIEKPEPVKEQRVLQPVAVKTFAALSGIRWDQIAGFAHYVDKHNLKARTVPEWHKTLAEYRNRPV